VIETRHLFIFAVREDIGLEAGSMIGAAGRSKLNALDFHQDAC
jgi:hypothetical protein